MITGVADRIQAKSKRLDVLINWAALSPTHVPFPLVFSALTITLGGERRGGAGPGFWFVSAAY